MGRHDHRGPEGLKKPVELSRTFRGRKGKKTGGGGVQKRKRRKCPQGRDLEGIGGFRNQKLDTY